ncbi:hypothetical protein F1737_01020 [Methanoplanus sp. FWC-SCC4]|uniref:Uncharacterized protein n=1 Tax=Methanochimaera problematica TaxID=2609417 RepID=A0AA97I3L7_9EURY|nr:hypothetical protein [Methanoplanus sp. FWC-SCC4]WOF15361.1 hypothetical protein F1737_01020 [Methanoplanus sp. FWC-SCC4]
MFTLSDFINLPQDENIVQEYGGFTLKKPQNAGLNIALTTKRLILYGFTKKSAKSGNLSLIQEMRINDIKGVEIYEKKVPEMHLAGIGILFMAASFTGFLNPAPSVFQTLDTILKNQISGISLIFSIGIIFVILSFLLKKRELSIKFKGRSENLNCGIFSDKTVIAGGSEEQRLIREIGSVIMNIQESCEDALSHTGVEVNPDEFFEKSLPDEDSDVLETEVTKEEKNLEIKPKEPPLQLDEDYGDDFSESPDLSGSKKSEKDDYLF